MYGLLRTEARPAEDGAAATAAAIGALDTPWNFQSYRGQQVRRRLEEASSTAAPQPSGNAPAMRDSVTLSPVEALEGLRASRVAATSGDGEQSAAPPTLADPPYLRGKVGAAKGRLLFEALQARIDKGEDYDTEAALICEMLAIDYEAAKSGSLGRFEGVASFDIRIKRFAEV